MNAWILNFPSAADDCHSSNETCVTSSAETLGHIFLYVTAAVATGYGAQTITPVIQEAADVISMAMVMNDALQFSVCCFEVTLKQRSHLQHQKIRGN